MNIISFVNMTYLRIVLIGYFHCIVYELHITVHNNYLYPADAYTGRDLSLFATINKQEL